MSQSSAEIFELLAVERRRKSCQLSCSIFYCLAACSTFLQQVPGTALRDAKGLHVPCTHLESGALSCSRTAQNISLGIAAEQPLDPNGQLAVSQGVRLSTPNIFKCISNPPVRDQSLLWEHAGDWLASLYTILQTRRQEV